MSVDISIDNVSFVFNIPKLLNFVLITGHVIY